MATRSCPECGSQYVASVRRCTDCNVNLVVDDEAAPLPEAVEGEGEGSEQTEVSYELEGWGNQLKVSLNGMLERDGVPAVWEAGTLVVPAAVRDRVDALIAGLAGTAVAADEDIEQVAFEIEGLDAELSEELEARLLAGGYGYGWNEAGELLVAAEVADDVEELIGAVLDGGGEVDDGLEANEALTALYLAADRLVKRTDDPQVLAQFRSARAGLDGIAVPFGLSADEWAGLKKRVASVAERIDSETDDDEIDSDLGDETEEDGATSETDGPDLSEMVAALRDELRDYV